MTKIEPPEGEWVRSFPVSAMWDRGKSSRVTDLSVREQWDRVLKLIDSTEVLLDSSLVRLTTLSAFATREVRLVRRTTLGQDFRR